MKNIFTALVLIGLGVYAYQQFDSGADQMPPGQFNTPNKAFPTESRRFSCDGRQHCSQMNSCAEATYFIKNCPNTKMDGDHDGVPCERQWCN